MVLIFNWQGNKATSVSLRQGRSSDLLVIADCSGPPTHTCTLASVAWYC